MFRPPKQFHIQHVEQTRTQVVYPMCERSFVQSTQGNIPGLLFDWSALRLVGELLRSAGVSKPYGYVIHRMDVIGTPLTRLEIYSQHQESVIFQQQMVVRLLLDWKRSGRRRFLRGNERQDSEQWRDCEPEIHGRAFPVDWRRVDSNGG
jgi:hypothetical protein